MNRNKTLAKNTIILGIGQFIPKVIALITLPILTGAFTTAEYGVYDLIISFSSLFLPLITLQIQQAVFRFIIDEKDEKICKSYITNSIMFVLVTTLTLFILILIVGNIAKINLEIVLIAFLLYFMQSIYDLFGQIARGYGKNLVFSIAVVVYSAINMILLLIALIFKCININNVIYMITISYAFATLFIFLKIKITRLFDIKLISLPTIKKLLVYSVPIVPSSISIWVVNLSDRLIITYVLGASYNGIFAAASKIPNLFSTVYNVFNLAWTEIAARSIQDKDSTDYYSKLFNNLYPFLFGIIMLIIAFTPFLFNILIDQKFSDGYFQMPVIFIGVLLNCFVLFYGGLYIALKKTKQVGISSFIGAILNIIINIIFINKIGLYAASISTVLSFLVILIFRIIDIKRFINISYNYKSIFIGIIMIAIVIINYYINTIETFVVSLIIAILYNILQNKFLIKLKNLISKK